MKRLLLIAYHFPPHQGSSGIQRTLRFAQYLPDFGWEPIVLTAHPRAYESRSDDLLGDVPTSLVVVRAQAWNTAVHFSVGGRYLDFMARPDRWVSWWLDGVLAGLRIVKRFAPDAIWSTYPIATAHKIARSVAVRTDLPWVADFRDPMAQNNYPADPKLRRKYREIERDTVKLARASVFTTPGALDTYRARYPGLATRFNLIENGYDESAFRSLKSLGTLNPGRLTLLHSGIIYPSERDPTCLFQALASLKAASTVGLDRLRIRFRAAVHEQFLHSLATSHDVSEYLEILPPLPYADALTEMLAADGLLVLQASNCNEQIPAKLYEYLRARRPIIALADPAGDTARTLKQAGVNTIGPLSDPISIARLLMRFIQDRETLDVPSCEFIQSASRRERTGSLASILEEVS